MRRHVVQSVEMKQARTSNPHALLGIVESSQIGQRGTHLLVLNEKQKHVRFARGNNMLRVIGLMLINFVNLATLTLSSNLAFQNSNTIYVGSSI
jgi:hypothetical protein